MNIDKIYHSKPQNERYLKHSYVSQRTSGLNCIKNLRVERFKKLSSRSGSPCQKIVKNTHNTRQELLNKSMLYSTINLNSQIKKFESTENEWKKLKQNMKSSIQLNDLSYKNTLKNKTSITPSFITNKEKPKILSENESKKLMKAIIDAKLCLDNLRPSNKRMNNKKNNLKKGISKSILLNFVESSKDNEKQINHSPEEIDLCDETGISKPNDTIRPMDFLNKSNSAIYSRNKVKENLNILGNYYPYNSSNKIGLTNKIKKIAIIGERTHHISKRMRPHGSYLNKAIN